MIKKINTNYKRCGYELKFWGNKRKLNEKIGWLE